MSRRRLLATFAACCALTAACGGGAAGREVTEKTTSRALAAAVIAHMGGRAVAAAPILPGQYLQGNTLLQRGQLAVEVAFDRGVGDNTHVRVVVESRPGAAPRCEPAAYLGGCAPTSVDGRPVLLQWNTGEPEEDPGDWSVLNRRGDVLVTVTAHGPFIHGDPRTGRLARFTRHLEELAADPAVGFETSPDDIDAGEKISDRVWLDWFGQDSGTPRPPSYTGPS